MLNIAPYASVNPNVSIHVPNPHATGNVAGLTKFPSKPGKGRLEIIEVFYPLINKRCEISLIFVIVQYNNIFWLVEMFGVRILDIKKYVSKVTRRHALANSILYLQVVVRLRYIFQKCDKS